MAEAALTPLEAAMTQIFDRFNPMPQSHASRPQYASHDLQSALQGQRALRPLAAELWLPAWRPAPRWVVDEAQPFAGPLQLPVKGCATLQVGENEVIIDVYSDTVWKKYVAQAYEREQRRRTVFQLHPGDPDSHVLLGVDRIHNRALLATGWTHCMILLGGGSTTKNLKFSVIAKSGSAFSLHWAQLAPGTGDPSLAPEQLAPSFEVKFSHSSSDSEAPFYFPPEQVEHLGAGMRLPPAHEELPDVDSMIEFGPRGPISPLPSASFASDARSPVQDADSLQGVDPRVVERIRSLSDQLCALQRDNAETKRAVAVISTETRTNTLARGKGADLPTPAIILQELATLVYQNLSPKLLTSGFSADDLGDCFDARGNDEQFRTMLQQLSNPNMESFGSGVPWLQVRFSVDGVPRYHMLEDVKAHLLERMGDLGMGC